MADNRVTDPRFEFVNVDESISERIAAPEYSYWKSVFRKFFSSKVAIFMMLIVIAILLLSIFSVFLGDILMTLVDPRISLDSKKGE